MATRSCCSTPRTAVAGARSATSAPAPCHSTKRSSASATIHTSWNCARPTSEPRQRIDTQSEGRSLETTGHGCLVGINCSMLKHRLGEERRPVGKDIHPLGPVHLPQGLAIVIEVVIDLR